ncbi:MAG: hypothetical protein ABH839_00825 [Chloroflexota bacterium]
MAKPTAGNVMAEGQQVVNAIPGFGTSCAIPGLDWPTKWRGTMQLQMNYTEYFYKAVKEAYGAQEAMDIYMDAHIMQGRLTGDIFKKVLTGQGKELNCYNFTLLTYQSSQMMGETFFAFQRPDGVIIYHTVNEPHARLFMRMVEGAVPKNCFERCMAWWIPALAAYNPEANIAWLTNCYEHGYCSFAVWDPDVTPDEPIAAEGEAFEKFGKIPDSVKGKSWGPYYLRKPYVRKDTVIPPPVDSSLYSGKKANSPCCI